MYFANWFIANQRDWKKYQQNNITSNTEYEQKLCNSFLRHVNYYTI